MKGHIVRDENGKMIFKINHCTLLAIGEHLEKKWQGNKFIITSDQVITTNHGRLYLWKDYTIETTES